MAAALNINDVHQAIQLALGPVFLLTGIAGLLNVMAGRLSRIIDRGRDLQERRNLPRPLSASIQQELHYLERRRHFASAAITACTLAALLVCMVVLALFAEVILATNLKGLLSLLFMTATLAMVVGLGFFLREVHLATRTIRILGRG